jgi:transposase
MARRFVDYNPDESFILPPDMRDWLPKDHLAMVVSDVVDLLNLRAIMADYEGKDDRGKPPFHPAMMVKLLVYAYCTGKRSSRKIERATYEEIPYRVLAANHHPDHDTIAAFRKRHLQQLAALFTQVLQLCQRLGMVKLGRVAVDGSKVKANASKHKAMSYDRMCQDEKRLQEEVGKLLAAAEQADAEDECEARDKGSKEDLPEELRRRETRLAKIREAKAELEEEARQQAEAAAREAERERKQQEAAGKKGRRAPSVLDPQAARPKGKAQKNFTDPESRIMKDGATKAFEQAYNAQVAVDGEAQIVVAAAVTQQANDKLQLAPMVGQVEKNLDTKPATVTADAGYYSDAAITDKRLEGIDLYVAVERQKHGQAPTDPAHTPAASSAAKAQMRDKLRTPEGKAEYAKRKQIVEPTFGQIKEVQSFRRFSFRGLANVSAEWLFVCACHNILKVFRAELCLASV